MSVYIMTHKPFEKQAFSKEILDYVTLQVGATGSHLYMDCYDDSGENISYKNSSYCELTGFYWIWKNCDDEYVGITHYRRFFSNHLRTNKVISEKDLLQKLKYHDIILPFISEHSISVLDYYCENCGFKKDLDAVRRIISYKYPKYLQTYDKVMLGKKTYFCNMLVCKKKLFDKYCEWLFDILFELESITDISFYNDYQKRIYGFLSERLLTVWVYANRLDIYEIGVVNIADELSIYRKALRSLKRVLFYYLIR